MPVYNPRSQCVLFSKCAPNSNLSDKNQSQHTPTTPVVPKVVPQTRQPAPDVDFDMDEDEEYNMHQSNMDFAMDGFGSNTDIIDHVIFFGEMFFPLYHSIHLSFLLQNILQVHHFLQVRRFLNAMKTVVAAPEQQQTLIHLHTLQIDLARHLLLPRTGPPKGEQQSCPQATRIAFI